MAEFSKIEWTDSTFNAWIGCTNISPGCDHCYAERLAQRMGIKWGNHPRHRTRPDNWKKPVSWNADAARFSREHGRRQRVFSASLSDWLDNQVDPLWRADLCKLVEATPRLDWLLLTKRPQNYRKLAPSHWQEHAPANVWLGITAEDREHYDQRWPILSQIGAVVRFISYEPAVGELGHPDLGDGRVPDWIISGGESGFGARVMRPAWARSVRDDCVKLRIAYFHKQWGSYASNPLVQELAWPVEQAKQLDPDGKGGKLLDGEVWHQFPTPRRL
jgi:protein gp37